MVEFENLEEIVSAIKQLENHGQYFLHNQDVEALDVLIDAIKTVIDPELFTS